MADEDISEEIVEIDISEWKRFKVAELRQRVAGLGLETKGTKADLIARVEKYLSEQEADLLEEEEDTEEEGGVTSETGDQLQETEEKEETLNGDVSETKELKTNNSDRKDIVKIEYQPPPPSSGTPIPTVVGNPSKNISSQLPIQERLKQRSQRFGTEDSAVAKKLSRAQRFGTVVSDSSILGKRPGGGPSADDLEKMKSRAQRFGSSGGSPIIKNIEDGEKKKQRVQRFNLSTVDLSTEDRKQERAQRFGTC